MWLIILISQKATKKSLKAIFLHLTRNKITIVLAPPYFLLYPTLPNIPTAAIIENVTLSAIISLISTSSYN